MKRVTYCLLFLFLFSSFLFAADKVGTPLTQEHQKWLDVVNWIISDYERKAFMALTSTEERDRFIDRFWLVRDPTLGTKDNEFKDEHYKRYDYANKYYGRGTQLKGSMTDEGHVYILLGKPQFTKRIPQGFDTYDMELWQYAGLHAYGLPTSLYVMFYQPNGVGPMRLYSPLEDGPKSLFIQRKDTREMDNRQLYLKLLEDVDPEVAQASLSSIPTDSASPDIPGTSLGSEVVIAKLQDAKNYDMVTKRKYVDDFLQDHPNVTVYVNMGSEGVADGIYWFQGPSGDFYMDYSVEYQPDKLDMGSYNDTDYYTSLTVDGSITSQDKKEVDQIVETHEIKLTKDQFQKIRAIPFQYQLRRPLVPGKYNFTMIISNNVSKKNATFVRSIDIPNLSGSPYITPLIPVLSLDDAPQDGKIRPFQFGNKILSPNLTGKYSQKGTMEVYHQVIFPEKYSPAGKLALHYVIKSSESTVEMEFTDPITMTAQQLAGNLIEVRKPVPLSKLNFGNKQLFVQLMDNQKVIFSTEPITFSVQTEATTSVWQFAVAMPAPETGFDNFILGQQLARLDRLDEAMALLENARRKNPDNVDISLQMMRVALRQRNYEKAQQIGIPLDVKNPRNKDLLWLMGWACYERQKYDDAVRYFERFRMENPKSIQALNLLADAYYRLQQPQKSLERVQESLAIKPDQKDILELKQKLQSNR